MATSYHGAILDHLAECMLYLSTASSFWFSLNSAHGRSISLSDRLGMSQHDYERLLVSADLADYHNVWGFRIRLKEWKMFIGGHRFTATTNLFEVATKKIDLDGFINGTPKDPKNRKDHHFIRIGVMNQYSPRKVEMQQNMYGVMIVTPPRLNRLRIKQQQFRQSTEQLIWNTIIEKEKDDEAEGDSNDSDDDDSVKDVPIVTPERKINSAKNDNMASLYPFLSKALGVEDGGGFDPTDPSVLKSMRSLLRELNTLLSTTYELNTTDMSNNKICYVRVPRTSSDNSFRNSKEWLDTAIQISGSKQNDTFNAAYRIANHLLRFYKDSVLAACETQNVPVCKAMTATQFQAMLTAGKVTGDGERELKKHLSAHLGKGFCPTRRSVDMLAEGHCKITYGCKEFLYDGKDKAEFVEWTEKDINDEITVYLKKHLTSKSVMPANIQRVQVVVGGDHGDTAFQFGASVSVHFIDDTEAINFEVSVCELICRKDTAKLIEETILDTLTAGLKIVSTWHLHIERNEEGQILCAFKENQAENTHRVDLFVTGDLAFQAMALGKESMAGWWCMLCKAPRAHFLDEESEMWTMSGLVEAGTIAETDKSEPKLGVKKKPWWPFIKLTNYVSPLLHCEIGIGNDMFQLLREVINEYIEQYAPGEESIRTSIPTLRQIIADTAQQRNEWDDSPEGLTLKTMKRAVATHDKRQRLVVASQDDMQEESYQSNVIRLNELQRFRDEMANKLKKARLALANQQSKLKEMRKGKVRQQSSIETQVFAVLKEIGVELNSYHGGSFNGKDIKKVMNNATYLFDQFAAIFKERRREGCLLSHADIDSMCLHFREVFVLWDGAFSLARTVNPTGEEIITYQSFVSAAVEGSRLLGCPVTPKVHTMLRHVQWQMMNLHWGLGDKMEDWVERLHQWGMQQRRQFRTVQNPLVRMNAREKAASRKTHPEVLAQVEATNEGNKRKMSETKVDILSTKRKCQREEGRSRAMEYFEIIKEEKLTWADILYNSVKGGGCETKSSDIIDDNKLASEGA